MITTQPQQHNNNSIILSNDPSLSLESLFFTNLLLLGFDASAYEREHRIPFNKDMFKSSNVRAMELIIHFLMGKLEGEKKRSIMLKGCWPILGKTERTEFKKQAGDWMKSVLNRNIQRTMLMTCYGENFYQLMHDLSYHVLYHYTVHHYSDYANERMPLSALQNDKLSHLESFASIGSQSEAIDSLKCLKNSLMLHIRSQSQQLLENTNRFVSLTNEWKRCADKISLDIDDTAKKHGQLHEMMNSLNDSAISKPTGNNMEQLLKNSEKLKEAMSNLKQMHEKFSSTRAIQNEMCETSLVAKPTDSSLLKTRDLSVLMAQYNTCMQQMRSRATTTAPERSSLMGNKQQMTEFMSGQLPLYRNYMQNMNNFSHELVDMVASYDKRIEKLHSHTTYQRAIPLVNSATHSYHLVQPTPPKHNHPELQQAVVTTSNSLRTPTQTLPPYVSVPPVTPQSEFKISQKPLFKSPSTPALEIHKLRRSNSLVTPPTTEAKSAVISTSTVRSIYHKDSIDHILKADKENIIPHDTVLISPKRSKSISSTTPLKPLRIVKNTNATNRSSFYKTVISSNQTNAMNDEDDAFLDEMERMLDEE